MPLILSWYFLSTVFSSLTTFSHFWPRAFLSSINCKIQYMFFSNNWILGRQKCAKCNTLDCFCRTAPLYIIASITMIIWRYREQKIANEYSPTTTPNIEVNKMLIKGHLSMAFLNVKCYRKLRPNNLQYSETCRFNTTVMRDHLSYKTSLTGFTIFSFWRFPIHGILQLCRRISSLALTVFTTILPKLVSSLILWLPPESDLTTQWTKLRCTLLILSLRPSPTPHQNDCHVPGQ